MPAARFLHFIVLQLAFLMIICTALLLSALGRESFHRFMGNLLLMLGAMANAVLLLYVRNQLACADCAHDWRNPRQTKASKTSPEMAR